jgi:hypothetical protein
LLLNTLFCQDEFDQQEKEENVSAAIKLEMVSEKARNLSDYAQKIIPE